MNPTAAVGILLRHFFRKAAIAVRKSGVVRLTALTSADRRTPSSNDYAVEPVELLLGERQRASR